METKYRGAVQATADLGHIDIESELVAQKGEHLALGVILHDGDGDPGRWSSRTKYTLTRLLGLCGGNESREGGDGAIHCHDEW